MAELSSTTDCVGMRPANINNRWRPAVDYDDRETQTEGSGHVKPIWKPSNNFDHENQLL